MLLGLVLIFGIVMGLMLIAYDDGVPLALGKKLMCKLGLHKKSVKIGKTKVNKYFCQHCKKPRKYPSLTVIDGGCKLSSNRYKF